MVVQLSAFGHWNIIQSCSGNSACSFVELTVFVLQDIDQLTLMRSLCKCVARVTRVKNIVPVLREAICAAQSDTPGPVFVEIPIDVLYPYRVVLDEIGAFRNARNFRQVCRFGNFFSISHQLVHFLYTRELASLVQLIWKVLGVISRWEYQKSSAICN